jgi:hypothetical protein
MTDWTALHSDVHISGGDGFSFIVLSRPLHSFNYGPNAKQSAEELAFVKQCLPNNKPRVVAGIEVPTPPHNALRMYLCEAMSTTFAYGHYIGGGAPSFIIGSRSQKDMFKLTLKFDETRSISSWDSNTEFYVRVAEGDAFSEDGSAQIGDRRSHSINEGW